MNQITTQILESFPDRPSDHITHESETRFELQPEVVQAKAAAMPTQEEATVKAVELTVKPRQKHIEDITRLAPSLCDTHGALVSAHCMLAHLQSHGCGKAANGADLRKPNAIGDALGNHGLKLPRILQNGKTYFAVNMADASASEKATEQARLNQLTELEKSALKLA